MVEVSVPLATIVSGVAASAEFAADRLPLSPLKFTTGALMLPEDPAVATTCAASATVCFSVTVASPFSLVSLLFADKLPLSLLQLTVNFGTGLPLASFTTALKVAKSTLLATTSLLSTPTSPLLMLAELLSAIKWVSMLPELPFSSVAVTVTFSATLLMKRIPTRPFSSVMALRDEPGATVAEPVSEKVTGALGSGLLPESVITALTSFIELSFAALLSVATKIAPLSIWPVAASADWVMVMSGKAMSLNCEETTAVPARVPAVTTA